MSNGVQKIFAEIPRTYDFVNHFITFGQDKRWRRKAAEMAAAGGCGKWIDVCTGTGDMAYCLLGLAPYDVQIYAVDFCRPMLDMARAKPGGSSIRFVEGDARSLPFQDSTFDVVTLSFAMRNIYTDESHLRACLREVHRILKPGGKFLNLETSQPPSPIVRFFFHLYVKTYVRISGRLLSASRAAYDYLSFTIPRFLTAEKLDALLGSAGFSVVRFRRMFLGVVAIHTAAK